MPVIVKYIACIELSSVVNSMFPESAELDWITTGPMMMRCLSMVSITSIYALSLFSLLDVIAILNAKGTQFGLDFGPKTIIFASDMQANNAN